MDNLTPTICYLPDGKPCPAVLTAEETISLLRLDGEHPERTLKFYRDEGQLVGIRIGKKVRYPLAAVMEFINEKVNKTRVLAR
jgi:hypothetical protein